MLAIDGDVFPVMDEHVAAQEETAQRFPFAIDREKRATLWAVIMRPENAGKLAAGHDAGAFGDLWIGNEANAFYARRQLGWKCAADRWPFVRPASRIPDQPEGNQQP